MEANNSDMGSPLAMALAAYLENYEPAQDDKVANLMMQAGYTIKWRSVDGKHGWAMRYRR